MVRVEHAMRTTASAVCAFSRCEKLVPAQLCSHCGFLMPKGWEVCTSELQDLTVHLDRLIDGALGMLRGESRDDGVRVQL